MLDTTLKQASAPELRAYVVWLPILPDDDATAAAKAAARFREPRAVHFWDPDRALGDALGTTLAIPARKPGRANGVAWDVYLLFGRGAKWGDPPALWMQQLDDVPATRAPRLDAAALAARINALPSAAPQASAAP